MALRVARCLGEEAFMTQKQAWGGFWLLALIWGSSFLFIRIGVEQIPPFQLVFLRTVIAAIGFNLVLALRGKHLPVGGRSLLDLFVLGTLNTLVPFALITWGETRIDSGLASVLQGTAALFTLIIAHFFFADERVTPRKLAGLLIGFLGVVVLASRSFGQGGGADLSGQLLGQAAIVVASFCYAIGGVYGRKAMQQRLEPMMVAGGSMTVAALFSGIIAYSAPFFGGQAPTSIGALSPLVLWSTVALGLVNTFGAYLLFYPLVVVLGATRTSMVTYVIPAVGIALGALVLGEVVDLRLLLGAILIIGGIGIVNLKLGSLFGRRPEKVEAAGESR
jgi:drug/metabolite transporter (DMT)-like permease